MPTLLQMVLKREGDSALLINDPEIRRRRKEAAARILGIQKRVKPNLEGWTSRDYINYGRR